jgi:hypothetical protein
MMSRLLLFPALSAFQLESMKKPDVSLIACGGKDQRMKCSGMISRRIHQSQGLEMMADLWIAAWGFQCNFRYKPVL